MSRKSSTPEEKESFHEVWEEFLLGNKSIEDILSHSEFLRRGMGICRWIVRDTWYDAEDLFIDTCMKMLRFKDKLEARNIPNVKAFFSWFHTAAMNIFCNFLRKESRL